MRSLLHNESGFSMIELLVVSVILIIVMGGLATIFSIGLTTSQASSQTLASQSGVAVALDRLDFEARCASSAALQSGGVGVTLTYASQCTHQGSSVTTVTWCVTGGSLVRYGSSSSCSGTGQTWATNITSAKPFSCPSVSNASLAELQVALTVNAGTTTLTSATGTDTITLQNATSASACS